ncbi:MAG: Rieske 2Fe-2S domain-containing protein [Chloroflexota bacterium]
MATATPAKRDDSRASIAKPSAEAESSVPSIMVDAPSRREFLYYIWGASIVLLLGEVTAGLLWFAYPRFREGEFGGVFPFNPADIPSTTAPPEWIAGGRFHVSNTEDGLLALYGVCTHLGCLPKWSTTNSRFECPCHGSKFEGDGAYIEGPAPRGLDRFPVTVTYSDGTSVDTPEDGGPLRIDPSRTIASIGIDTGSRITGPSA